jgi:hypothetical protein
MNIIENKSNKFFIDSSFSHVKYMKIILGVFISNLKFVFQELTQRNTEKTLSSIEVRPPAPLRGVNPGQFISPPLGGMGGCLSA